jgi:FMN-dependent NADH-azoreductase
MNILQINSSARTTGSVSTSLADLITQRLRAKQPEAQFQLRDLAELPHPFVDQFIIDALAAAAAERSPEQAARVALNDALIAQIQAADIVVLGVPMYNFNITVQLKTWIDAIVRPGVTYHYTDKGPEGLLTGKKVHMAMTRGGMHQGKAHDTQVPYLTNIFHTLGMTDISFVFAEGLLYGDEAKSRSVAAAQAQIEQLLA